MTRDKAIASRHNVPWLVLVLLITCWVFWQGQRLIRADALASGARKQVGQWVSGAAAPGSVQEWQEAHAALEEALAVTPENPGLQEHMGDLHAVAGRRDWQDENLRMTHFRTAATYYKNALELRPTDPQTWASLAAAYQGTGETGEPLHQAWQRARQLGPNEGHVQPMLLETALATWATASPAMQRWAMEFFGDSAEPQRKAINAMAERFGLRFDLQPAAGSAAASAPTQ